MVPYATWLELGLDTAPFAVQSCAPMNLVHFYFSQLTLSCVFVVDKGRFTGGRHRAWRLYLSIYLSILSLILSIR